MSNKTGLTYQPDSQAIEQLKKKIMWIENNSQWRSAKNTFFDPIQPWGQQPYVVFFAEILFITKFQAGAYFTNMRPSNKLRITSNKVEHQRN